MSKIYSLLLEKAVVRILADFFKQRFNKIIIKNYDPWAKCIKWSY